MFSKYYRKEVRIMTGEEVYYRTMQEIKKIKSMNVQQTMIQEIKVDGEERVEKKTKDNSNIQIIFNPLTIHIKETTDTIVKGISGELPMKCKEMYQFDNEVYVNEDYSGNEGKWLWRKVSSDDSEQKIKHQMNFKKQFSMFKNHANNIHLEQSDNSYILKMKMKENDKSFNDFIRAMSAEDISNVDQNQIKEELQRALESVNFNSMSLTIITDKEQFVIKGYNVEMDMTMESEGQKNNITQTVKNEYGNINNIATIELPGYIKNSAIVQ